MILFAQMQNSASESKDFLDWLLELLNAILNTPSIEVWGAILVMLLILAACVAAVHWTVPNREQFDSWQRHTHHHYRRRYRRHHRLRSSAGWFLG
jgi:hypothetical protein